MKCKDNKEIKDKMMMEKALNKNDLENKNKNLVNRGNKNKINKDSKMNNYKKKIQLKIKGKKALKRGIKKDKSCNRK